MNTASAGVTDVAQSQTGTASTFEKAQKRAKAAKNAKKPIHNMGAVVAAANVEAGKSGKEARVMPAKVAAKIATNEAHKTDAGSMSFCMKRVIEFNAGYIEKLPNVSIGELKRKQLAPADLIALMTDKEAQRFAKTSRVTVWGVMTLLGRLSAKRSAK